MAHAWKACWVQALGGSNPPFSANHECWVQDSAQHSGARTPHTPPITNVGCKTAPNIRGLEPPALRQSRMLGARQRPTFGECWPPSLLKGQTRPNSLHVHPCGPGVVRGYRQDRTGKTSVRHRGDADSAQRNSVVFRQFAKSGLDVRLCRLREHLRHVSDLLEGRICRTVEVDILVIFFVV